MTNYKKLDAWKKAMELVRDVYLITSLFPKEELYGITSQIKRAAVSVPANIAEGNGRQYKKDTIQFLHVSRGSLYELETLFSIAVMVGIMDEEKHKQVSTQIDICLQVLNGFINYLENSNLK
jgi:four helix bundle protein